MARRSTTVGVRRTRWRPEPSGGATSEAWRLALSAICCIGGTLEPVLTWPTVTEIPEHLLARSRERRSALGLGGDGGGDAAATPVPTATAQPATSSAASPAPIPAAAPPAPPKPPKPDLPWVAAAKRRRKVPAFAQVMLVGLPLWALIFAFTNDVPTSDELTLSPKAPRSTAPTVRDVTEQAVAAEADPRWRAARYSQPSQRRLIR